MRLQHPGHVFVVFQDLGGTGRRAPHLPFLNYPSVILLGGFLRAGCVRKVTQLFVHDPLRRGDLPHHPMVALLENLYRALSGKRQFGRVQFAYRLFEDCAVGDLYNSHVRYLVFQMQGLLCGCSPGPLLLPLSVLFVGASPSRITLSLAVFQPNQTFLYHVQNGSGWGFQ